MNICTIATEGEWVDVHAARWLRKVRAACPGAVTHLLLSGGGEDLLHPHHPVVSAFDKVHVWPVAVGVRPWFNRVRLEACSVFGVERMVYLDADADVLADIGEAVGAVEKRLAFCRSPIINPEWQKVHQAEGWGVAEWMADNCLLVMRGDFLEEYDKAVAVVAKHGVHPRTAGTIAFNVMVKQNPALWEELPRELSCIWWEQTKWTRARVVQYCNDKGKAKRERLEALWRARQEGA